MERTLFLVSYTSSIIALCLSNGHSHFNILADDHRDLNKTWLSCQELIWHWAGDSLLSIVISWKLDMFSWRLTRVAFQILCSVIKYVLEEMNILQLKNCYKELHHWDYPLFCRHGINSAMIKIKRCLTQQVKQYAFNKRESGNFKEVWNIKSIFQKKKRETVLKKSKETWQLNSRRYPWLHSV